MSSDDAPTPTDAHTPTDAPPPADSRRLLPLALGALGVVFGDIGTSPLYALRGCFSDVYGLAPSRQNVLGVLSLILWSLVVVISVKYVALILRADNRGEGGILAMMALTRQAHVPGRGRMLLAAVGLAGAALLYGDGVLTPAISVLSAVEGIGVATPALRELALPLASGILVALFLVQHRGTAAVGGAFGPVSLLWFLTIAALGVGGIAHRPEVLAAVNPAHAVTFMVRDGFTAFYTLGAVFLVVTGGEALYADMGHFGRRPIRFAWFALVLPALLLNYFGQGALLLAEPHSTAHPFYHLAPDWALYPLVVLATAATIIASQAVISGCFSLTRQAVQLGYCPRLRIDHTSYVEIGQIYVPAVNRLLMVASIGVAIAFGSSAALAGAYGIAVSTTMVITTILFVVVASDLWHWSAWVVAPVAGSLLLVDLAFLGANALKIGEGGWVPLALGGSVFVLMATWRRGRNELMRRLHARAMPLERLIETLRAEPPVRVPGTAVFLMAHTEGVPTALLHNLKHNHVLHEHVVILTVETVDVPVVKATKRFEASDRGDGFYRVLLRTGFMESPNIPELLALAKPGNLDFAAESTTYFLGRESILIGGRGPMPRWQRWLFALMSRGATRSMTYFGIPPNRVVELGIQVEL